MSRIFSRSKSPRRFEYITTPNNFPLQLEGKLRKLISHEPKVQEKSLGKWNIGINQSFTDSYYSQNKTPQKFSNNPNKSNDSYRIIFPERNVIGLDLSFAN